MLAAVRRPLLLVVLAAIALLVLAWAYLHFTPLAIEGVRVGGPQACRPMEPAQAPQARWVQDRLQVQVDVSTNCAATVSSLRMQRLGSLLLVRSVAQAPAVATGCWCSRTYLLEADGLPRHDYRVVEYAFP